MHYGEIGAVYSLCGLSLEPADIDGDGPDCSDDAAEVTCSECRELLAHVVADALEEDDQADEDEDQDEDEDEDE